MSDRLDMLLSGSGLQLGKGNNYRDAAWLGECDKVGVDIIFIFFHPEQGVAEMAKRLGWQSDLENLIKGGQKESGKSSTK